MNPVDTITVRSLIYADQGRFMGIADVQMTIEWLTKTAEEIPLKDITVVRKWTEKKLREGLPE
jgi:hypothetical protein